MDDRAQASDHALMRRTREGDPAAFEQIVRRWEGRVARVLGRLVHRDADVEDLCQETFLRVYKARGRYRPGWAFSTWLYRIVLNVARDHARRGRGRPQLLDAPGIGPVSKDPPPGEAAGRRELNGRLARALRALPRELHEALALRHFAELTFDQIARVARCPAGTAKSRVYAALRRLRSELHKLGIDEKEI